MRQTKIAPRFSVPPPWILACGWKCLHPKRERNCGVVSADLNFITVGSILRHTAREFSARHMRACHKGTGTGAPALPPKNLGLEHLDIVVPTRRRRRERTCACSK